MSDAYTDMARDHRRFLNYLEYLETLFKYLTKTATKRILTRSAKKTDLVMRGFWSEGTNLASEENLNLIKKLKKGDSSTWLSFLATLQGETQKKFQDISPFAEKFLLSVVHEHNSIYKVNSADLKTFLESKTAEEKRHWSRLSYVIALDPKVFESAEVQVFE